MIRIVEIDSFLLQGLTQPVLCRAEDNHQYVVKGKYAGNRTLIAEWIANRLGKLLGLPIPNFEQLQLDPELLKYSAKRQEVEQLGPKFLFGSQYENNLVEVREADLHLVDLNLQAKVLAFDWWVANSDRIFVNGRGNPNLLWNESQQKLIVIDHNLAFDPKSMDTFWNTHAFRNAKKVWSSSFCMEMDKKFKEVLNELQVIWSELPEDWTETTEQGINISFESIQSLLWKFDRESDIFWGSV